MHVWHRLAHGGDGSQMTSNHESEKSGSPHNADMKSQDTAMHNLTHPGAIAIRIDLCPVGGNG
jgi:hypothetical protein